ncbi:MAG: MFS transporter, partial [Oceanospirillales bacterium]|nr:MFS transporter [Oceanospirillales bacterium]
FEVITLGYLGENSAQYSRIRLWGSVGFILAVVLIGWLLDWTSIEVLPFVVLGLMLLIWLNTLLIEREADRHSHASGQSGTIMPILRKPQVLVFFLVCFLVQFSHGPYYTFYSVLMQELGYQRGVIGLLWALGVAAEVVMFALMPRLLAHFSLRALLLFSVLMCVLRWSLTAWLPEQFWVMLFAQCLHAATFGSFHAVGIALVQHYFSPSTQGRGQALFSSVGFGAGGALGAIVTGQLWGSWDVLSFGVAAAVSVLAMLLALIWIFPGNVQQHRC